MNNENKFNEEWWDKNPMTYEDWNLSKDIRSSINIDKIKKINSEYIDSNPYLNDFFKNLKNDNQENTVLDIGCGWGSSTVILSKIFKKVYSIDISAKSILAAKENIRLNGFPERVNLSKYDAEKLNFINYFDLIFSWGVIHHSYDAKKILENIFKGLNLADLIELFKVLSEGDTPTAKKIRSRKGWKTSGRMIWFEGGKGKIELH